MTALRSREEPPDGVTSFGLWLAPHPATASAKRQLRSLSRQVDELQPGVVLLPEGWLDGRAWGAVTLATVQARVDALFGAHDNLSRRRLLVGVQAAVPELTASLAPAQLLVAYPDNQPPYVKHSSAGAVAFQRADWAPRTAVPVWRGGIGPFICHDLYLSLIAHASVANGARVLANATGTSVVPQKWQILLRARALENRVPVICTMSGALNPRSPARPLALAFDGHGRNISLRSGRGLSLYGTEPGVLYVKDADAAGQGDVEIPLPRSSAVDGTRVSVRGDSLFFDATRVASWGAPRVHQGTLIMPLGGSAWRDPCIWLGRFVAARGRVLFWIRPSQRQRSAARAIALARAIELSVPTIIEEQDQLLVAQRTSIRKHVALTTPPTLIPLSALNVGSSFESAFRMMAPGASRTAWRNVLGRYLDLMPHAQST